MTYCDRAGFPACVVCSRCHTPPPAGFRCYNVRTLSSCSWLVCPTTCIHKQDAKEVVVVHDSLDSDHDCSPEHDILAGNE